MMLPLILIGVIFMMAKSKSAGTNSSAATGAAPKKTNPNTVNTSASGQHVNQAQAQSTATQLETAAGGIAVAYAAKGLASFISGLSSSGSSSNTPDPSTINGDGSSDPSIDETDLVVAENDMGSDTASASLDPSSYDMTSTDEMDA